MMRKYNEKVREREPQMSCNKPVCLVELLVTLSVDNLVGSTHLRPVVLNES